MKPSVAVRDTVENFASRGASRGEAVSRPHLVSRHTYLPLAGLDSWAARGSSDPQVENGFASFSRAKQHSWTYDIPGPVWCEPVVGRVIDGRGRVLRQSFTYWHLHQAGYAASMRSSLTGRGTGAEHR